MMVRMFDVETIEKVEKYVPVTLTGGPRDGEVIEVPYAAATGDSPVTSFNLTHPEDARRYIQYVPDYETNCARFNSEASIRSLREE